ncbi:radical SAM family heme chaperone HemW [Ruixingdingia sedimenti]|uniref:Heme chaperone HemW n=1 Tax=Ruixingdingia sedimenti TaxID=3073604 RepID=A0ABU1F7N7_9RHOB|nr:radical SAM family heme chaperone HemW [Xinfangfangia sp. LG-4]MDR5652658.1 radical SAM family heme chaperone HemW [Xinfangfangia sp. LG-4]
MEDWRNGGFGLYIHWPFCVSKCPYCDFNSHVAARIDQRRWQDAYLREIDRIGAETRGRRLDTVFFGGGTPSLMAPQVVAAILERVRRTWPLANDLEVTLEANPGTVEAARFRGFREAGVNRISIGIQALDDESLRLLGRLHSAGEGRRAIGIAQDLFERVSFDLIYARQNQSAEDWQAELRAALAIGTDHLSLYQLTIEDGTAFGDRFARGRLPGLPTETVSAEMYEITQEICDAAGLPAYEISNHARPGAESRHNIIYWNGGDYAGVGPGAHGRLTLDGARWATETLRAPGAWLEAVEQRGNGETPREAVPADAQGYEYLMMGLRRDTGVSMARLAAILGVVPDLPRLAGLEELDLLQREGDSLRATRHGRMVLNSLLAELLTDANF